MYTGMLHCLAPSWHQIVQIRISFRSHSDLVLDADQPLIFYPISFFRRACRFPKGPKIEKFQDLEIFKRD